MFLIIFLNYYFDRYEKISIVKIFLLITLMAIGIVGATILSSGYLSSTSYELYVGKGQLVINIYLFAAVVYYIFLRKYNELFITNSINKVFALSLPVLFLVFPMQLIMVIMYRMIEFFLPIIYTMMAEIWKNEKILYIKVFLFGLYLYKIIDFFMNCKYLGIF